MGRRLVAYPILLLSESALPPDWHPVTRYCHRAVTPGAYGGNCSTQGSGVRPDPPATIQFVRAWLRPASQAAST